MKKLVTYVIQKDEDGFYVADVPDMPGCHTQAKTLDELETRIKEAISLYLMENSQGTDTVSKFVGVYQTEVTVE